MKKTLLLLLLLLLLLSACSHPGWGEETASPAGSETLPAEADNSPEEYVLAEAEMKPAAPGTPTVNYPSGVYHDSFVVTLATEEAGCTVRYTQNGDIPAKDSPAYTGPIPVEMQAASDAKGGAKVYCFRAASFDADGNQVGDAITVTYILAPEGRFTTKVVALTAVPNDLTGPKGIFRRPYYDGRGREWERPVEFQLFGTDGTLDVAQSMGMRVNGTGSRSLPQKNLRLFARREYSPDEGHLHYPLFAGLKSESSGREINEFDTVLLRGGASNFKNTVITTQAIFDLIKDTEVGVADFEPAACFMNGDYYGLVVIMEDYGPYFFEEHFGVPEDKVSTVNFTVVNHNTALAWEHDDGPEAEFEEWRQVRSYISRTNLASKKAYEKACSYIDVVNFADYIIMECYIDNWDWPRNNVRVWRYNGVETGKGLYENCGGYAPDAEYGLDGRWRFLAKDLDCSMSLYDSSRSTDFFRVLDKDAGVPHDLDKMFWSLMKNLYFRKLFLERLARMMSYSLSPEHTEEIITTLQLQMADEMRYQDARYSDASIVEWDRWLSAMRTFAEERPAYVVDDVAAKLNETLVKVKVGTFQNASLTVNGAPVVSGGYFYTLRSAALTFSVEPVKGCTLSEIKVSGLTLTDTTVSVSPGASGSFSFTPVIEGTPEEDEIGGLCLNEIGHSDREKVNGYDWVELYNPTDEPIDLRGMTLTNGIGTFTFDGIKVPAKGFKVIFCTDKQKGGVYTGFSLSSEQTVTLTDAAGKQLDSLGIFPNAKSTHIGRSPDGGEVVSLTAEETTPNASNIHASSFVHRIDDRFRNAVLYDQKLQPAAAFSVNEDGALVTSIDALKNAGAERAFIALLYAAGYRGSSEIRLGDLSSKLDHAKVRVFASKTLNSYTIWVEK